MFFLKILDQVRAAAVFALGNVLDVGFDAIRDGAGAEEDCDDDEKVRSEAGIVKSILSVVSDGSPLVRAEVAVGTCKLMLLDGIDCCLNSYFPSPPSCSCLISSQVGWPPGV